MLKLKKTLKYQQVKIITNVFLAHEICPMEGRGVTAIIHGFQLIEVNKNSCKHRAGERARKKQWWHLRL